MSDLHVSTALLTALETGEISSGQMLRIVVAHLESCRRCGVELEAWRSEPRHGEGKNGTLLSALKDGGTVDAEEQKKAEADLNTLLELDEPDKQRRRIQRSITRFRSPQLAALLLRESDEERVAHPALAQHYAELALSVLWNTKSSRAGDELRIRAIGHLGAACKAQGDLASAEERYVEARRLLDRVRDADLATWAELDYLEGGYQKDRRRLDLSARLLERAIRYYELLGESRNASRARLVLASTQFYRGSLTQAVATTERALEELHPVYDERLFFMGRFNLTYFLVEADRADQAAQQLKVDADLYRRAAESWPNLPLHFHWLAGKIQRGLGKLDLAESHLLRARDGFARHGTRYDAILVCLDLCLVYMARNRPEEVLALSDVMVTSYAADGLHQEALAAVKLFAEAARAHNTNQRLVKEISQFLEFSRLDPTLKCDVSIS